MPLAPIIQFPNISSQKSYIQNFYLVFPLRTHNMFKINTIFNISQINTAAVRNYLSTQFKRVFLVEFKIRKLGESDTSCSVIM